MLPNDIDTGVFTDEALTIITSMQQDGVMKGELQYKSTGYPPKQDYTPFINTPKACSFTDEQDEKEFARRFRLADELNAFGELLQPKFVVDEQGNMYILHKQRVGFCVLSYSQNRRVGEEYVLYDKRLLSMMLQNALEIICPPIRQYHALHYKSAKVLVNLIQEGKIKHLKTVGDPCKEIEVKSVEVIASHVRVKNYVINGEIYDNRLTMLTGDNTADILTTYHQADETLLRQTYNNTYPCLKRCGNTLALFVNERTIVKLNNTLDNPCYVDYDALPIDSQCWQHLYVEEFFDRLNGVQP
jgi:hypothetical protein|nr:MAG TPA: hypothetical protein [Caudoviricetes sp.]